MEVKYELSKNLRDTIVNYLSNITVQSTIGHNLITIVQELNKLNEIKNEVKKEEPVI
jgi:hypothetical protein